MYHWKRFLEPFAENMCVTKFEATGGEKLNEEGVPEEYNVVY